MRNEAPKSPPSNNNPHLPEQLPHWQPCSPPSKAINLEIEKNKTVNKEIAPKTD
jgi:hypothetical protein